MFNKPQVARFIEGQWICSDDNFSALCNVACRTNVPVSNCTCPKYVFVTAGLYNGNLGGLTGADAICQSEANTAKPEGDIYGVVV